MEIKIRTAAAEDYKRLCELFDEVDALHRAKLPHIFEGPDGPVREHDYYLEWISDEKVGLFLAELGEKTVGFVHIVLNDTPAIPIFVPRRYAVVDSIGVSSKFQNRGIGRMLMDTVHTWAISRGATSVELNVYEFNKSAIVFYKSLGYDTLSRKMSKELKSE